MNDPNKDIEIEIKLKLESYPEYLKLLGFLGQMDNEERLQNAFYDTPGRELSKANWAYRVRVTSDSGLVTLKGLATVEGAAAIRPEIQEIIPKPVAFEIINDRHDPLDIDCRPVEYIKNELGFSSFVKTARFEILRQSKKISILDREYLLELDTTTFGDGSSDYELEVELSRREKIAQAEQDLAHLFESLNIPFNYQMDSKYARALANQTIQGN